MPRPDPTTPIRLPFAGRIVEGIMERSLRSAFRRIEWVGPQPEVPADRSVVLYMNHHTFFDGYLGWLIVRRVLGRRSLTWMREWDRFPFFAAAGALPFPVDDPARRASTFRTTARRFAAGPDWGLIYFPEGHQHAAEDGLLPFHDDLLRRLDRVLPAKVWVPAAIHVTMAEAAHPVVRLAAGPSHAVIDGTERDRLQSVWDHLRSAAPADSIILLEGRASPQERWDFSFSRRFFRRFV